MHKRSLILILLVIFPLSLDYAALAFPAPNNPPPSSVPVSTPQQLTVEDLARTTIDLARLSIQNSGNMLKCTAVMIACIFGLFTISSGLGIWNFFSGKKTSERVSETTLETGKKVSNATSLSDSLTTAQTALMKKSLVVDCYPAIEGLNALEADFPVNRVLHIYLGRLYRKLADHGLDTYDNAIMILRKFIDNIECNPELRNTPKAKIDIADANYNIACYHALKAKQVDQRGDNPANVERLISETIGFLKVAIRDNPQNLLGAWEDKDFDYPPVREMINKEFGERIEGN